MRRILFSYMNVCNVLYTHGDAWIDAMCVFVFTVCMLQMCRMCVSFRLGVTFKPGVCWPVASACGFLKLILCGSSVCVCVRPEAINK